MIRRRKDRNGLQVQVHAGRDRLTGRKRWVTRPTPQPPARGSVGLGLLASTSASLPDADTRAFLLCTGRGRLT
jgi:hypothetical protein